MKKIIVLSGVASLLTFSLLSCSDSGIGKGASPLTAAAKMSNGIGGSVDTIQGIGGAMGSNGTFSLSHASRSLSTKSSVHSASALTKCSEHAEPGDDVNSDGVVDNGEKYSTSNDKYALQSFYCTLASDTDGPESVSGAVGLIKQIVCAVEKQTGTLPFDGVPVAISGLTLDRNCASQASIDEMGGVPGAASATLTIPGGATVTSSLNPNFSEITGNTHYSHGIRIASNTPNVLKFIVVAKFNPASANPLESGDFEFATLGTGSMMQGTAIEYTAGKIYGTGTTKHLWYEARMNRFKANINDPLCQPGNASSSCGFARHIRLSTDISFLNGDVDTIANFSGIISDSGDSTGSGQNNNMRIVTATGSLATGLTGKIYQKSASPVTLGGGDTLAGTFVGMGETGVTTCIPSQGAGVTTTCPGMPSPLAPAGPIKSYMMPANTNTWFTDAGVKGGLGFTGSVNFSDEQFVNP